MKKTVLVLGVVLILITGLYVGCFSEKTQPLSAPTTSRVNLMQAAPSTTTHYVTVDLQTLRTDPHLADVYEDMARQCKEGTRDTDIDPVDIDYVATAQNREGDLMIFAGRFDLDDVEDSLEEEFETESYRGESVWTKDHRAVAVLDDLIVVGNLDCVRDSIKAKTSKRSMYERDDIKRVIDKLPEGLMLAILVGEVTGVEDCTIGGSCISKKDEDTLLGTTYATFKDAAAAENAVHEAKEMECGNLRVKQRGNTLETICELDILDVDVKDLLFDMKE